MEKRLPKKSIFWFFLIPLLVLMVIQSSLILGIIEFRDVVGSIQSNSVENTEKATENRRAGWNPRCSSVGTGFTRASRS